MDFDEPFTVRAVWKITRIGICYLTGEYPIFRECFYTNQILIAVILL